jgi:hypothetical protein
MATVVPSGLLDTLSDFVITYVPILFCAVTNYSIVGPLVGLYCTVGFAVLHSSFLNSHRAQGRS